MQRRDFLKQLSALGVAVSFPTFLEANNFPKGKTLVLIELKGGNDGINTLIPYANPVYYQKRKDIAIKKEEVIKINDYVGFHPSLKKMSKLYKKGELACMQGVGYPNANRSHFRSIEIWEAASGVDEYFENGWVSDALHVERDSHNLDALVFGKDSLGPMYGKGINTLIISEPDKFINSAKKLSQTEDIKTKNSALQHLLETQKRIENTKEMFAEKLISTKKLTKDRFEKNAFAKALYHSARVIVSEMDVPVIKLSLGSFDTHSNQTKKHAKLLENLGNGLSDLRDVLKEYGKWDDVLVMTYCEFGRRVQQNASKGTDHGKATVHFALGGGVKGGLYGKYPSLSNLDNGDLKYNLDFRSMYRTIVEDWWSIKSTKRLKNFSKIKILY